jgi:single-stranded DNA-binding protein
MISTEIRVIVTLGRSADEKQLASGKRIYETTGAFNGRKDRDGNRATAWFKLKLWGRDGQGQDFAADEFMRLSKGDSILVVGDVQAENWTGQNGEKKEGLVIEIRSFGPAYWPREGQDARQPPKAEPAPRQSPPADDHADFGAPRHAPKSNPPPPMPDFGNGDEDDIPF